jgi:hypothetical protein
MGNRSMLKPLQTCDLMALDDIIYMSFLIITPQHNLENDKKDRLGRPRRQNVHLC